MTCSPHRPEQTELVNTKPVKNRFDRFNKSSNAGAMLKLALLQAAATLVFSGAMYYCYGTGEALSALFGGMTAAIMSVYMASRLFTTHRLASVRDMSATERLSRFYASAILKVLFTLLIMGILIAVIKVSMLPFIIAYLIAAVAINLVFLLYADT